jgi:hypothetical protein
MFLNTIITNNQGRVDTIYQSVIDGRAIIGTTVKDDATGKMPIIQEIGAFDGCTY